MNHFKFSYQKLVLSCSSNLMILVEFFFLTHKIGYENPILLIFDPSLTQVTTSPIKRMFCWFNFLGKKNLHCIGRATV